MNQTYHNQKRSRKLLSALALPLVAVLLLCACSDSASVGMESGASPSDATVSPALLRESTDRGRAYVDSFIFFGESTTYHLKNRGVLSEGTDTRQVWAPDNGTATLDETVTTLKLRYPDTGEYLTVSEAAERKKPQRLLLTFGLNGATASVRRGKDYFQSCYQKLIDAVRTASPATTVILGACFPVAESMDMSRYTVSAAELNGMIDTLNSWTLALAEQNGLPYLNSAEALKGADGFLRPEFDSGDGYHLTRDAYLTFLHYLRTHSDEKGDPV